MIIITVFLFFVCILLTIIALYCIFMMGDIKMKRLEDLTKVFDRTWNANHNDVAKRGREKEKAFMNKMFNVKETNKPQPKTLTPGERAANLQNNINSTFNFQKQTQINNIVKKWK